MSSGTVLYDALGPRARRRARLGTVAGGVLIIAGAAWVVQALAAQGLFEARRWDVFADAVTWGGLLRGLAATGRAAVTGALLALVLGVGLAIVRTSPGRGTRALAATWIEFFRGMPVVLLILFTLLAFGTSPFVAVVSGLTLYNGAVIAEVLRAGIQALPAGQREAGLAIGLTPVRTLLLIEFPQAVRTMLPALISQFVVLLKDTSLGFIVSYPELLRQIRTLIEFFGNAYLFSVFGVGAAMYIAVNLAFSRLAVVVERRTAAGGGPRAGRPARGIDLDVVRGPAAPPIDAGPGGS